jgi:hypothetical protein
MTITRGFLTIILSGFVFAVGGALIGYTLGVTTPGYYRAVFSAGREPWFDPAAVGFGLGITQGLVLGVVVGAVVVLAVAWHNSRRRALESEFDGPLLVKYGRQSPPEHGITSRPNR